MTTKKPSTVTSATGAYAYKSGVSSTATNYIDNTFPNLLDKTGDYAGIGGGVTGEIEFLSGSSLVFDTGAVLQFTGSSVLAFGSTSELIFNNSSILEMNDTSNLIVGSSASLLCGGTLNITSGGTFHLKSTGTMHIESGATQTVDSGGNITFSAGSTATVSGSANINFGSGSNLNMNAGSYLTCTDQTTNFTGSSQIIEISSGATFILPNSAGSFLTVGTGNTLNVHGTHKTDVWPQWNTAQLRSIIESTTSGIAISGTWAGGLQFVYDTGTGGVWAQQLYRTHHGATLYQLFVGLSVGTSHASVPAVRPSLSLIRYNWTGMFSPQALSTVDPQYFPNPGSGAAYYNGGAQQYMNYVCNQNNVIDNENYIYVLSITDESGAGSQINNAFGLIYLDHRLISSQMWNT